MNKNYLLAIILVACSGLSAQLSVVATFNADNELKEKQLRDDNYFKGQLFYFGQGSSTTSQLYKTDGTTISLVKEFGPVYPDGEVGTGISVSNFNQTSDKLFFTRYSMRFNGATPLDAITELWASDGTGEGTVKVLSYRYMGTSRFGVVLNGESNGTYHTYQNSIGNKLIFNAYDPDSPGNTLIMWVTDGTANGTHPLLDSHGGKVYGGVFFGTRMNGKYYFGGRAQNAIDPGGYLYETDGTNAGTKKVNSGLFYMSSNTSEPLNGKMLFWANTVNENYELWESDGTDAGTKPFTGLNGTAGKKTYYQLGADLANDGRQVYFTLQPSSDTKTAELWATDFTPGNTRKIRNESNFMPNKITLGNGFVFIETWNFQFSTSAKYQLVYSDGTAAGTRTVMEDGPVSGTFGLFKNELYFPHHESRNGAAYSNMELWRSDGTPENTKMIYDIYPGEVTFYTPPLKLSSSPRSFFSLGNSLYFVAKNGNAMNLYRLGDPTSVDRAGSSVESVFPNPFKETLTIRTNEPLALKILNLQGKVVLEAQLTAGDNPVTLSDVPEGMYIVTTSGILSRRNHFYRVIKL